MVFYHSYYVLVNVKDNRDTWYILYLEFIIVGILTVAVLMIRNFVNSGGQDEDEGASDFSVFIVKIVLVLLIFGPIIYLLPLQGIFDSMKILRSDFIIPVIIGFFYSLE